MVTGMLPDIVCSCQYGGVNVSGGNVHLYGCSAGGIVDRSITGNEVAKMKLTPVWVTLTIPSVNTMNTGYPDHLILHL
jgi:hypothetical protein